MQHEPPAKKRAGSVEPLERPASSSPLPELPDDLKHKQVFSPPQINRNNESSNLDSPRPKDLFTLTDSGTVSLTNRLKR